MREKKGGALSRVQKLKKRLSHSFGRLCKYILCFKIIVFILIKYKIVFSCKSLGISSIFSYVLNFFEQY